MTGRVLRGEIYLAEMDGIGSEQKGYLPVLVTQNDVGNVMSSTTVVACISRKKAELPTQIEITQDNGKVSTVMCEHLRTISKARLAKKVGFLDSEQMMLVEDKIKVSLGMH